MTANNGVNEQVIVDKAGLLGWKELLDLLEDGELACAGKPFKTTILPAVGGISTPLIGVDMAFAFSAAACNLIRLPKLLAEPAVA